MHVCIAGAGKNMYLYILFVRIKIIRSCSLLTVVVIMKNEEVLLQYCERPRF